MIGQYPEMHSIVAGFVPPPQTNSYVGQQAMLGYSTEAAEKHQAEWQDYQGKVARAQVHILAATLAATARRDSSEPFATVAHDIEAFLLRGLESA